VRCFRPSTKTSRKAWGVLYELSDEMLHKLPSIEGDRYRQMTIRVIDSDGNEREATTFVVREESRCERLATSAAYVSWIIYGLRSHGVPEDWIGHVVDVAVETNNRAGTDAIEQTRIIKTL